MKLKIKITGPKVHGVGYRYFLLKHALLIGLKGFHAENRLDNGNQVVNVLVEGDEQGIDMFVKLAERSAPEHADVSNVSREEYAGEVPRAGEYAQLCTVVQVDKALPVMREDLQPGLAMQIRELQVDIKAIKERLGMP